MSPRLSVTKSQSDDNYGSLCIKCKQSVGDKDSGVQCDRCNEWSHAKCVGITSSAYNSLRKVDGFRYFCPDCSPNVDRLLALENRLDTVEERVDSLSRKLANFSIPLQTFPPVLNQKKFSGTLPLHKQMPFSFNDAVSEAVEAKLKRHNAVLFGLPESDDDTGAVRKLLADYEATDEDQYVKESEILYTFRDGKQMDDMPRLLKVITANTKVRDNFIRFINKTAKTGSNLPLRSRPDLTFQQRQDGRSLREKLTELDPDESGDLYINYGKRSIFSKSARKFIFSLDNVSL